MLALQRCALKVWYIYFSWTKNVSVQFLQEWEGKAADDKKRYKVEYKKWFENGGKAAIEAHKEVAMKVIKKARKPAKSKYHSDFFDPSNSRPSDKSAEKNLDDFLANLSSDDEI